MLAKDTYYLQLNCEANCETCTTNFNITLNKCIANPASPTNESYTLSIDACLGGFQSLANVASNSVSTLIFETPNCAVQPRVEVFNFGNETTCQPFVESTWAIVDFTKSASLYCPNSSCTGCKVIYPAYNAGQCLPKGQGAGSFEFTSTSSLQVCSTTPAANKSALSPAIIAGIAVGGVALIILVVFLAFQCTKNKKRRGYRRINE